MTSKTKDHSMLRKAIQAMRRNQYCQAEELLLRIGDHSFFYVAAQVNLAMLHLRHNPNGIDMAEGILSKLAIVDHELFESDLETYLIHQTVRFEVLSKQNRVLEAGKIVDHVNVLLAEVSMTPREMSQYANFFNSISIPMLKIYPTYALELLESGFKYINDTTDSRVIAGMMNNRGNAFFALEDSKKAFVAFSEGKEYSEMNDVQDEVHRANVGMAQTKQVFLEREDIDRVIIAAKYSRDAGDCEVAVKRTCIAMQLSISENEIETIKECAYSIVDFSKNLDIYSTVRNQALYFAGSLFANRLEDEDASLDALSKAAQGFFSTSTRANLMYDKKYIMVEGHFCFRELANLLLEHSRVDEACMLMELARFYGWAFSFSDELAKEIVANNPLKEMPVELDTTLLHVLAKQITQAETQIHLAIIPPNIVAFFVSNDGVDFIKEEIPASCTYTFLKKLHQVPQLLKSGLGLNSIPQIICQFAEKMSEYVKGRNKAISKIIPYAGLHLVPWREVLQAYNDNLYMSNLTMCFSGLERSICQPIDIERTSILTYFAKDEEFGKEADEFMKIFSDCNVIDEAESFHISDALKQDDFVYVSCHGEPNSDNSDVFFKLEDGVHLGTELVPDKVNAKIVVLSSCDSATFFYAHGEVLSGTIPYLLSKGCDYVIATRFPISQIAALRFAHHFSRMLKLEYPVEEAFSKTKEGMLKDYLGVWEDVACIEIFSR
ncbi:MAG: CHAT domain-containing protein [Candidatus Sabulitectum sp.]|nr:CHAT domain-containing protein [Candidatus Sabulitectum sp.]